MRLHCNILDIFSARTIAIPNRLFLSESRQIIVIVQAIDILLGGDSNTANGIHRFALLVSFEIIGHRESTDI